MGNEAGGDSPVSILSISASCSILLIWAVHPPMLYASLTSEAVREGWLVVPSLPAMTTPNGDAIMVSSMRLLGGLPTTTCPSTNSLFHSLVDIQQTDACSGVQPCSQYNSAQTGVMMMDTGT